jgi:hypothetical protein
MQACTIKTVVIPAFARVVHQVAWVTLALSKIVIGAVHRCPFNMEQKVQTTLSKWVRMLN